jgi:hypothetical protein
LENFIKKNTYLFVCSIIIKYLCVVIKITYLKVLCNNGGELVSIGFREDRWHVGAGLTPYNLIRTIVGNTFAKLSTLGLIREESAVAA